MASGVNKPGRIRVRVKPGASRSEIIGWQASALVVRVTAPPVDGKANQAVVELLAEALDVPKSFVVLVVGASSRTKTLEIAGLSEEEIVARLAERP